MKRKFLIILILLFTSLNLFGCKQIKSQVSLGNIVILGDSYSTFSSHIPEGYASWYKPNIDYTDVTKVEDTWWHKLVDRTTNSSLALNSSYSGSTICNTGYDGKDASSSSFITRFKNLVKENSVDLSSINTLIIYGGLNDYWANAPYGDIKYTDISEQDLFSFYPAVISLLQSAKTSLPNARVVFIIEEYLSDNLKQNLTDICTTLDVEYIKPQNISKKNSHPDKKGMEELTNQIIASFENSLNKE